MRLQDALRDAIPRLHAAVIADAPRDARLLLAHATAIAPDRLTLHLHEMLTPGAAARYDAALTARCARQPLSQITGHRLFWGRSFRVTGDVLDPRPETEILVAAALEKPFATILDLGTGSGAILLSCLAERPLALGLGTDISEAALAVARQTAADLGLTDRTRLQVSDWFRAVGGRFDLILSNPPYLAADEMAGLSPEVHDWEPHLALTPGGDGLDAYRRIARHALAHLTDGGRLLVEIGPTQGQAVAGFFAAAGLRVMALRQDMDGRDRVVEALKP